MPTLDIRHEFIGAFDEVKYSALKDGNTGQNEVIFVRITYRARAIEIENVHSAS